MHCHKKSLWDGRQVGRYVVKLRVSIMSNQKSDVIRGYVAMSLAPPIFHGWNPTHKNGDDRGMVQVTLL